MLNSVSLFKGYNRSSSFHERLSPDLICVKSVVKEENMGLHEIVGALKTTSSLCSALLLTFSKAKTRRIVFKNGSSFFINFSEYYYINELVLLGYRVEQLANSFRVSGAKFDISIYSSGLDMLVSVAKNKIICTVHQLGEDLFDVKGENFRFTGSKELIYVLQEQSLGVYHCDCEGETVLDIGGFQGESAVLFSAMGAKKVIIYEPVFAHLPLIRQNIEQNGVNAEIHTEGVGEKDSTQMVNFEKADLGFNINGKGPNKVEITLRNVADVISLSQAKVAKFDCEGSETCLVTVPTEILRKIDYYIIETHSQTVKHVIVEKFINCGYKFLKDVRLLHGNKFTMQVDVIHFKKEL
jgi:FkbM family methyltransferase